MSSQSSDLSNWEQLRGVINSTKGGWVVGQGVTCHGYSLLDELVGKVSFFETLMLNITGSIPDPRFAQWMEAAFICCSWPDPRIWCNQISALGGDARVSGVSAVCAGSMSGDSSSYGPGSVEAVGNFLNNGLTAVGEGMTVAEFVEARAVVKGRVMAPGFVRPVAVGDARVVALERINEELGLERGPYQELAFSIGDYLLHHYGEAININAYSIAVGLDQGYTLTELERLMTLVFNGGLHACYAEYRDLPPDSFLPLRCDDIDYAGVGERSVPELKS